MMPINAKLAPKERNYKKDNVHKLVSNDTESIQPGLMQPNIAEKIRMCTYNEHQEYSGIST